VKLQKNDNRGKVKEKQRGERRRETGREGGKGKAS
jgi:hypothetical protein